MHREISAGTLDSPSWDLIRAAKLATRMYAPLGTRMSLGDYVRVVRTFLEAFKVSLPHDGSVNEGSTGSAGETDEGELSKREDTKVLQLRESLSASPPIHPSYCSSVDLLTIVALCLSHIQEYQNGLVSAGIKDDRVRRPLTRVTIVRRMLVRLAWSLILFCICLPGLVLWLPIFFATWVGVTKYLRTGPIWDTYDEIGSSAIIIAAESTADPPVCLHSTIQADLWTVLRPHSLGWLCATHAPHRAVYRGRRPYMAVAEVSYGPHISSLACFDGLGSAFGGSKMLLAPSVPSWRSAACFGSTLRPWSHSKPHAGTCTSR